MLEESTGNFSATRNIYDWYQNQTHVIVNVMVKNLKESDVKVRLIDEQLDVTCDMANGSVLNLHFNLLKSIIVGESSWSVTPSKLEIKLKKTDKRRWPSLEVIPEKGTKRKEPSSSSYSTLPQDDSYKRYLLSDSEGNPDQSYMAFGILTEGPKEFINEPKVKHHWCQNTNHVFVSVNILNLNPDKVKVCLDDERLMIDCSDQDEIEYQLHVKLFDKIKPTECSYSLTTSKLEVKLAKENKVRWDSLEGPEGGQDGQESELVDPLDRINVSTSLTENNNQEEVEDQSNYMNENASGSNNSNSEANNHKEEGSIPAAGNEEGREEEFRISELVKDEIFDKSKNTTLEEIPARSS